MHSILHYSMLMIQIQGIYSINIKIFIFHLILYKQVLAQDYERRCGNSHALRSFLGIESSGWGWGSQGDIIFSRPPIVNQVIRTKYCLKTISDDAKAEFIFKTRLRRTLYPKTHRGKYHYDKDRQKLCKLRLSFLRPHRLRLSRLRSIS